MERSTGGDQDAINTFMAGKVRPCISALFFLQKTVYIVGKVQVEKRGRTYPSEALRDTDDDEICSKCSKIVVYNVIKNIVLLLLYYCIITAL